MTTTANEFKQQAAKHFQDAADSFDRCDTDGFLSQWASDTMGRKAQLNATIAENGGEATFWTYTVTDLDGNPLNFRRANTVHGFKLVVDVNGNDVWIDPHAKRPATNRNKGVIVGRSEFSVPAHAITWAPRGARGLGGCASVQVIVAPKDSNVKWDGRA